MSGLDTLQTRIQYRGGKQEGRMIKDKEKALKKALLYSYQACTAILADGREFRCLINPDKLKTNYDDKIISIPFKDICVGGKNKDATNSQSPVQTGIQTPGEKTSEGEEEIGMKAGDVFTWKETNSHWLVYLQRIEEDAYFRAEIRRCRYEVKINDNIYKVYAAAIDRDEISWITKQSVSFNELNYGLNMYITKNAETEDFFHRFTIVEVNGKPWEVQAVDAVSTEGIIQISLKEYYQNSIQKEIETYKDMATFKRDVEKIIQGPATVYPYDIQSYNITGYQGEGSWYINNNKAKIVSQSNSEVTIEIISGRSGTFDLIYKKNDGQEEILTVSIESF